MARKLCDVCSTRPVGYGYNEDMPHTIQMGYCGPCMTEAEWENRHNDEGHEPNEMDHQCWFCHPELNEASKTYTKRETKGHHAARRPQLSHGGCYHEQAPKARRECRNAFWATGSTDRASFADFSNKAWLDAGYVVKDGMWVLAPKVKAKELGAMNLGELRQEAVRRGFSTLTKGTKAQILTVLRKADNG